MIRHRGPWDTRSTISRSAHVLERIGLALTGASCGLFVAAHVGRADIDLIGSAAARFALMIFGGGGVFSLGPPPPPAPADHKMHWPRPKATKAFATKADAVELLSAAG